MKTMRILVMSVVLSLSMSAMCQTTAQMKAKQAKATLKEKASKEKAPQKPLEHRAPKKKRKKEKTR